MKKINLIFTITFIFLISGCANGFVISKTYNYSNISFDSNRRPLNNYENLKNKIPSENNISFEILFCPKTNCSNRFVELTKNANHVICALYDINLIEMYENIDELIVESSANVKFEAIQDKNSALMHHKFCIIDNNILWTGSFNPTKNCNYKNNNNVVIVNSKYLVENYLQEFDEMKRGIYGGGSPVKNPFVHINGELWENYFCPEDNCKDQVLRILSNAEKNVYFMTFSFTDNDIAKKLVEISRNIHVEGVMEYRRLTMQHNQYKNMKDYFKIHPDKNPHFLHHKVFIIDEKIVITGSYNPTNAGNERNDENILIIRNEMIANLFLDEFFNLSQ